MSGRRGQAVVEVIALAPLVTALVAVLAVGGARVAATARAEAMLARALAADAAGEPIVAAVGQAATVEVGHRIVVVVKAPFGDVRRDALRVR